MDLEDVIWHDVSEACFSHDADHERRLCDELHTMVPEQRQDSDD